MVRSETGSIQRRHCLAKKPEGLRKDHDATDPDDDNLVKSWSDYAALPMVCFGSMSAPLTWSRVAAAVGRLGGSILLVKRGRLQVYLDDPLFHLQGSKEERDTARAIVPLTWRALGSRITWSKGQRGKEVDCIGLWFGHNEEKGQIIVRIPDGRIKDMKEEAKALRGLAMVPASRLRRFAGRLSWVCNILKRLR